MAGSASCSLTVVSLPLQAEFREQHGEVMALVHHCLASGMRVQRSVLDVALKIVLEAEYNRNGPVSTVGHFLISKITRPLHCRTSCLDNLAAAEQIADIGQIQSRWSHQHS